MEKMEELISAAKLSKLLAKDEEGKRSKLLWIIAIIGAAAAVALLAVCIYKFFAPDYMDDFEDEFEDDFEDDFFDDDDEEYEE